MEKTTYYNLNIVEGTDIVNPLVVDNPNYEKIDDSMHTNAVNGVTLATEIANARVHALTRANSECAVIRFIATSEWMSGDTMTVDGVTVTTQLPSGESLPDGAYVINANVLCILTGTNLTVYAERKKTDSASEITYKDTNVAGALDTINSNLGKLIQLGDIQILSGSSAFLEGAVGLQTVNINFEVPFKVPPVVLVSWRDNMVNVSDYFEAIGLEKSATINGFTVGSRRKKTGYSWAFSWIAIGVKS